MRLFRARGGAHDGRFWPDNRLDNFAAGLIRSSPLWSAVGSQAPETAALRQIVTGSFRDVDQLWRFRSRWLKADR